MNPQDSVHPLPEPSLADAELPQREPEAPPPRSKAVTPITVKILSEPDVVLDDPPAIFGGGSHTW